MRRMNESTQKLPNVRSSHAQNSRAKVEDGSDMRAVCMCVSAVGGIDQVLSRRGDAHVNTTDKKYKTRSYAQLGASKVLGLDAENEADGIHEIGLAWHVKRT